MCDYNIMVCLLVVVKWLAFRLGGQGLGIPDKTHQAYLLVLCDNLSNGKNYIHFSYHILISGGSLSNNFCSIVRRAVYRATLKMYLYL